MWKRTYVIMKNLNLLILRCFVIVSSAYSDLDQDLALSIIKFLKLRDHTNSKTDLVVKMKYLVIASGQENEVPVFKQT